MNHCDFCKMTWTPSGPVQSLLSAKTFPFSYLYSRHSDLFYHCQCSHVLPVIVCWGPRESLLDETPHYTYTAVCQKWDFNVRFPVYLSLSSVSLHLPLSSCPYLNISLQQEPMESRGNTRGNHCKVWPIIPPITAQLLVSMLPTTAQCLCVHDLQTWWTAHSTMPAPAPSTAVRTHMQQ